ncbi:MAG: DJ-1/PfpI family protein [Planctomycetes bacterium]|nr:DJ-1/PfpI family protein [Planctomycetota bacterium]
MSTPEKILVPLAPGFEEIEFVTIVDVLRRADLDVTVASLQPGSVRGSHGIEIAPDAALGDLDTSVFTLIVLPGGQPGTRNLAADGRVLALVRRLASAGAGASRTRTAAICAAPVVLHAAGILRGVEVTAHPSVHKELVDATVNTESRVVRSGSVCTSQGAGTALEFALALVAELKGAARAAELRAAMRA